MDKMLDGRVAIITGSGRGIGKAAALLFAQEGAKVVVSDIDPQPAEETVAEIKQAGGEAICFNGDATGDDFAEGIVGAAVDAFGGLHIIVNNAGYTWDAVVHRMTDKQWDAIMDIHVKAPFRIIRAAAPYFRDAAKKEMNDSTGPIARKIVNISSMAGVNGNPGQANYSSGKAGIIGLTKAVAKEWGRFNIQSNAVAYGWVDTRLTKAKEETEDLEIDGEKVPIGIPGQQREMIKMRIPLGRPGTPEEGAGVILFLASPLSNYVSGQCINMSGGT